LDAKQIIDDIVFCNYCYRTLISYRTLCRRLYYRRSLTESYRTLGKKIIG